MDNSVTLTDQVQDFDLKHKTQEELLAMLLEKPQLTEEGKRLVSSAYTLAAQLHQNDQHRNQPYVYHLLRGANRIAGYLHIYDPEIIAASLLHDSVEDHAADLSPATKDDPVLNQQAALQEIAMRLTPRTAQLVGMVTNAPETGKKLSEDEELAIYREKVKQATSTPDGWVIKFADWCDNGLGIDYGAEDLTPERIAHFQRKYGGEVLETLERRFREPDIQAVFDWAPKGYIEHQFSQGHQRLPNVSET